MLSIIGKLINQLRVENDMTIEALAQKTGISSEKLEAIENGSSMPSLGILFKITRSLGSTPTSIQSLVEEIKESVGIVVTRARTGVENDLYASAAPHIGQSHSKFFSLFPGQNDRHMEPLIVEIADSDTTIEPRASSEYEGEEFIYVLKGSIVIKYGTESYTLERGDSIYYDTKVSHTITNNSPETSKILTVIYTY